MAALKLRENMDFDGNAVYHHVKNYLPSYARPRFIRIQVEPTSKHDQVLQFTIEKTTLMFCFLAFCLWNKIPLAGCPGGYRNIQANEDKAGRGRFQPCRHQGHFVLPGGQQGLRADDAGDIRLHRRGKTQTLSSSYLAKPAWSQGGSGPFKLFWAEQRVTASTWEKWRWAFLPCASRQYVHHCCHSCVWKKFRKRHHCNKKQKVGREVLVVLFLLGPVVTMLVLAVAR